MKRIVSVLLIIVMSLCAFSCAPSKKSVFKNEAKSYFDTYSGVREIGKCKSTVKYTKNGAYAIERPVTKTALDDKISDYCDKLRADLQKGDTLFVSYRAHAASDTLGSIEVVSKKTTAVGTQQQTRVFHFTKSGVDPMTEKLSDAITAIAMAEHILDGGDTSEQVLLQYDTDELLFTKNGVVIKNKTIGYGALKDYLPEDAGALGEGGTRAIDPGKKMVAITYDDGPCKYTDELLDIFEENGSVATFFELGQLLSSQPDALKRMDSLGCEIASHTWSHKDLAKCSDAEIKNQLDKTDDALMELVGKKATLMRPPYGSVSKRVRSVCDKPMIGWSVDTLDWQSRNADKVIAKVKGEDDLDGDVILMHSLYPSTVEATRVLVPWLIENGYQLVTVSELFAYKYQQRAEAGKYYTANYFG